MAVGNKGKTSVDTACSCSYRNGAAFAGQLEPGFSALDRQITCKLFTWMYPAVDLCMHGLH